MTLIKVEKRVKLDAGEAGKEFGDVMLF